MVKIKKQKLSFTQQLMLLRKNYKNGNYELVNNGFIWNQKVKTSENSKEYIISLEYYAGKVPKVSVKNQGLLKYNGERIEHSYNKDNKYKSNNHQKVVLCLYYPKYNEWNNTMSIADTIIPWAIEWIYYYEIWRITGKWIGEGIHDSKK